MRVFYEEIKLECCASASRRQKEQPVLARIPDVGSRQVAAKQGKAKIKKAKVETAAAKARAAARRRKRYAAGCHLDSEEELTLDDEEKEKPSVHAGCH